MNNTEWIDMNEAIKIASSYRKGPKNLTSIVYAGTKGNFIRKTDGFHWQVEKNQLIRYCEISNKTTLKDISKQLNISYGSVQYLAMKNNIPLKQEMGRKFLEDNDAKRIIDQHRKKY